MTRQAVFSSAGPAFVALSHNTGCVISPSHHQHCLQKTAQRPHFSARNPRQKHGQTTSTNSVTRRADVPQYRIHTFGLFHLQFLPSLQVKTRPHAVKALVFEESTVRFEGRHWIVVEIMSIIHGWVQGGDAGCRQETARRPEERLYIHKPTGSGLVRGSPWVYLGGVPPRLVLPENSGPHWGRQTALKRHGVGPRRAH